MVELQNKFKEKVNIVLVNSREELAEVQKKNIKVPPLAALYGQKVFKELFPHGMIPHHVWLDQSGRVLAITSDLYATEQNVEAVLQKKIVEFTLKDDELRDAFHDKMLMKARDASFEGYYSAFFPYNASMPGSNRIVFDSTAGIFWTRLIGIGPFELLKAAFFENTNEMEVKYEMSDTVKIKIYIPSRVSIQQLDWHTKYNYTYELKGDLADFPMWREKAQLDINFFTRKRFGIYARKELDPLTEKYILIISDSMVN